MRAFFEALGGIFEWTFGFLPSMGPTINNMFILIISVSIVYWILQMRKHAKAGEK